MGRVSWVIQLLKASDGSVVPKGKTEVCGGIEYQRTDCKQ
jgi:hypothetical protein